MPIALILILTWAIAQNLGFIEILYRIPRFIVGSRKATPTTLIPGWVIDQEFAGIGRGTRRILLALQMLLNEAAILTFLLHTLGLRHLSFCLKELYRGCARHACGLRNLRILLNINFHVM